MLKFYKTVTGYGQTEIEINKSRFIAYVERVESEEAAVAFVEKLKRNIGMLLIIVLPIW